MMMMSRVWMATVSRAQGPLMALYRFLLRPDCRATCVTAGHAFPLVNHTFQETTSVLAMNGVCLLEPSRIALHASPSMPDARVFPFSSLSTLHCPLLPSLDPSQNFAPVT